MSDTKLIPLGDLVEITGGGTPNKKEEDYWNGNIPWASVKDISRCDKYLEKTIDTISDLGLRKSASNLIPAGSVIVPTRMLLGVAVINSIPVAINQDLKAIKCSNQIDPTYLTYCINANKDYFEREGTGATVKGITLSVLRGFKIPLPPLPEQKRIAAILDKADELRQKRRQAIAKLDELLQATFLDMFGDPVTNPKGWEVTTIGEEVSFLTSGSRGWAKYYADKGDLFIRIQNLKKGKLDLSDIAYVNAPDSAESTRTRVCPGDVLLSITADLGRTAVIPEGNPIAYINQHLAILRFKTIDPQFVSYQLATNGGQSQFTRLNKEGVKAGLNFTDVRSIKLIKPPAEQQKKFNEFVESLSIEIQHQSKALAQTDTLFSSLQQRAFKGQL